VAPEEPALAPRRAPRVEVTASPSPAPALPLRPLTPLTPPAASVAGSDGPAVLAPPSWESAVASAAGTDAQARKEEAPPPPADAEVEEEQVGQEVAEALGFLTQEFEAEEVPLAEPEADAVEPARPTASWEQIGLFDEEEVVEAPDRPTKVELTPSFDFGAEQRRAPAHEPEDALDPTAAAPARAGTVEERVEPAQAEEAEEEADTSGAAIQSARDVLHPAPSTHAAAPEPALTGDDESGRWSRLVFEAGCAILEQKRVAVSMLERRFGLDFDQACRVLDELQAAGLIGPYMGGRSRDILLTREEWLAHAPQAS
jgi:hypothetical protein